MVTPVSTGALLVSPDPDPCYSLCEQNRRWEQRLIPSVFHAHSHFTGACSDGVPAAPAAPHSVPLATLRTPVPQNLLHIGQITI